MSSVSEIFERSQIAKSEYAVYAGFDESLIKSGVGYLEQIHVFVSEEVDANSPLLAELGELFSPFSSILFTASSRYRMPVFKDGNIRDFDELTHVTASKFADGGSSAKTPLTVISLSQTPRVADGPTGLSRGGSRNGDGKKNEKHRSKKGKERYKGDNGKRRSRKGKERERDSDKGDEDEDDESPDDDPPKPFDDRGGIIDGPAKIFFEIVSHLNVYPICDSLNAVQTLTMDGSLTIKVVFHSYLSDYGLINSNV